MGKLASFPITRRVITRPATETLTSRSSPLGRSAWVSCNSAELQETHADLPKGEERDVSVSVAGRVMTRRVMGKLAFFTLADETGSIQLFLEKAGLEAQQEGWFKQITTLVDSGDWLGVSGTLRRTDRGELSVKVSDWRMLTKALQPLPDKWHGLADVEKRYRQRYLDLVVSPDSRETFRRRARLVSGIRRWLDQRDFLEIETPVLQSCLLYTSPSPRDATLSRMPSSA